MRLNGFGVTNRTTPKMFYNVKRLCAGGDLVVQLLNLVQKPIRITGVQFIPNAPLAQNRC